MSVGAQLISEIQITSIIVTFDTNRYSFYSGEIGKPI